MRSCRARLHCHMRLPNASAKHPRAQRAQRPQHRAWEWGARRCDRRLAPPINGSWQDTWRLPLTGCPCLKLSRPPARTRAKRTSARRDPVQPAPFLTASKRVEAVIRQGSLCPLAQALAARVSNGGFRYVALVMCLVRARSGPAVELRNVSSVAVRLAHTVLVPHCCSALLRLGDSWCAARRGVAALVPPAKPGTAGAGVARPQAEL